MDTHRSGTREAGRTSSAVAVLLGVVGLVLVFAGASGSASVAAPSVRSPVVVAARALSAGAVVAADDVAVSMVPASIAGLRGLLHAPADAIGRRIAVALPEGAPLQGALLLDPGASGPGHRLVRLPVEATALPPSLQGDELVDVVAAVVDPQSSGGRLVTVTTGRVVSITTPGGDGASGVGTQPMSTLTLDVDMRGAQRLLWAESFAKTLHILARPPGDNTGSPADVNGLGGTGKGG